MPLLLPFKKTWLLPRKPRSSHRRKRPRLPRPCKDLPPELLSLIVQPLTPLDRLSFAGVCKSWRSAACSTCTPAVPLPWLILIGGDFSGRLLTLHLGTPATLLSPRPLDFTSQIILGSKNAWIVMASPKLHLINRISSRSIPLPEIASGQIQIRPDRFGPNCFTVHHVDISSSPNAPDSDCILVARGHREGQGPVFGSCRPGDREWITFVDPREERYPGGRRGAVFYKGEYYVIGSEGDVLVYGFDPRPEVKRAIASIGWRGISRKWPKRFLESRGELLAVVWQDEKAIDETWTSRVKLDVFKLEGGEWVWLRSLGDRALLIGLHGAESFSTKYRHVGFDANCVYYHCRRGKQRKDRDCVAKQWLRTQNRGTIALLRGAKRLLGIEWITTLA